LRHKIITCCLALCGMLKALNAHSEPLIMQANKLRNELKLTNLNQEDRCTNFSGNWSGSCVVGDGKVEKKSQIRISQDSCEFFISNGAFFIISGTSTFGHNFMTSNTVVEGSYSSTWNEDQTVIQILVHTGFQNPNTTTASFASETISLEHSKLRIVTRIRDSLTSKGQSKAPQDSDCIYNKN